MGRARLVAAVLAGVLAGAGCRPGDGPAESGAGPGEDGGATAADARGDDALPPAGGRLSDMAQAGRTAGGTPESEERLAQWGRASFDGDTRLLDSVNGGSAVYAGAGSGRTSYQYPLSQPRRVRVAGSPPPAPAVRPGNSRGETGGGAGAVLAAFKEFQRKAYEAAYPVLSRLDWGAAAPREARVRQNPYRITIHNTAGHQTMGLDETVSAVRGIQSFHQNTRGWSDIAYHFLIDGQGRVVEGRPVETLGSHAGGANQGNIGVALMGDFNKDRPTAAQIESLERLVSYLSARYGIDPASHLTTHQHLNQTDCPGRHVMELFAALRAEASRRTNRLASTGWGAATLAMTAATPRA